jgi:2-C-methyl-D-erythritol 4-phosphate cytidylyltransferase
LPAACLDLLLEQGLHSPDGAILAMPVGDTLKRAGDELEITDTVDRTGLWAAQTPQLFRIKKLAKAIDMAHQEGFAITDEASAMEFAGARPKLVMGSVANIKITHPSDLAIAGVLLGRKEQAS